MSALKDYLGDAVYADFDGYHIVLTTENGSSFPSNTICLEPSVLHALNNYAKRMESVTTEDIRKAHGQ